MTALDGIMDYYYKVLYIPIAAGRGPLKIREVEIIQARAQLPDRLRRVRQRSVRVQDLYDSTDPSEYHDSVCHHYIKLLTDDDCHAMYGPISAAALPSIRDGLASVVVGSDPNQHNLTYERMLRSERHIRTGHGLMGVSALDNALWDLRGRMSGKPVYQLLGGATRQRIPAYASTLGYSHEHEALISRSQALAAEFPAQKWFLRSGPVDRNNALTSSIELAETLRGVVGENYPLMFDAVMGWDLALAEAWWRRVSDVEPTWLEEPFPAYDLSTYKIFARSGVPLAAGEHIYGRWEANTWLQTGALRYLQCDPEWCGGVSELVRISTLCSAYGTVLVPHGANIHAALHVVASQPPWLAPYVEFLIDLAEERALFERDPVVPSHGTFDLPTRPGFGLELNLEMADDVDIWTYSKNRGV